MRATIESTDKRTTLLFTFVDSTHPTGEAKPQNIERNADEIHMFSKLRCEFRIGRGDECGSRNPLALGSEADVEGRGS